MSSDLSGSGGGGRPGRGALRRRDAGFARDGSFGPNMTPMVDVVLVLLIFFMSGATLFGREFLLPARVDPERTPVSTGAVDRLPEAQLSVILRRENGDTRIDAFGRSGLTMAAFGQAATEAARQMAGGNVVVTVEPEPEVRYDAVVRVYDACVGAGFERVRLR